MITCIVIEDQLPARRILQKYIADAGYLELVEIFTNALDALEYLRDHKVDLLFLDIHLPRLSGIDFLAVLKDQPYVILTTAFPEVRLKRYLEMRGADGGPWARLCALPALWAGLLYHQPSLDAAWDIVRDWSMEERLKLRAEVPRLGLRPFRMTDGPRGARPRRRFSRRNVFLYGTLTLVAVSKPGLAATFAVAGVILTVTGLRLLPSPAR